MSEASTTQRMKQRIADLENALRFYADPRRYGGPNQRVEGEPDRFQPDGLPYLYDVTRDGGELARKALGSYTALVGPRKR